ncbi:hypothetical protein [Fulvivirga lutimaris]|uniref:hypothetical protein n=1 Tax=Fulvivirga lutimaris TaxID=1819566 RepID=UPI0012BD1D1D|nr:hypothetical protein [Fulvivirga lutimaris]MTI41729.1 hypothetical protein [Fulvivirga lutimaris]
MKSIFIMVLLCLSPKLVHADCLACWSLRNVEISLANGDTISGFIYWNDQWVNSTKQNQFPKNLLEFHRDKGDSVFTLLKEVKTINNDSISEIKAINEDDKLLIRVEQVIAIKEINKDDDIYWGAGELNTFTLEEINKLNTNPISFFHKEIPVTDIYYLSYNSEINKKKLIELSELSNQTHISYESMGVIIITVNYD